jgi:exodeoxyribonuclease V alpha subunit
MNKSAENTLSFIDLFFAQRVLKRLPSQEESHATLLATLFALSRLGHLVLATSPRGIETALEILSMQNNTPFAELLLQGIETFPYESPWLVRTPSHVYLQKNWTYESEIAFHLKRLHEATPSLPLKLLAISELNATQQEAVQKGLEHSLSFLSGGPGTGKTFTAAHLVKMCPHDFRIILTAPTGKAAFHLEANLKKTVPEALNVQTATLHALLKLGTHQENEPLSLSADLILVDECSMIDARVFARLLASVTAGTRLVLIGDPYQLPPVEAGSLFADLVETQPYPTTHLTLSLRSSCAGLLSFAEAIKRGDADAALSLLHSSPDLEWIENPPQLLPYLWERFGNRFVATFSEKPPLENLMDFLEGFSILSCLRQGPCGVDALNAYFFNEVSSRAKGAPWMAIPLMITGNDYDLALYNGDLGILLCKARSRPLAREFSQEDIVVFQDPHGGIRTFAALSLTSFTLSYCLSVHKSQGSEYEEVLIIAPEGAEVFGREVLYTAVTRAKKKASLVTTEELLRKALLKSSRKLSGFTRKKEPL